MFNLFKKKEYNLLSVVDGKTIPLSQVPDPVFAEKMAGDGIAIDSTGDIFVSPCDGELSLVFKTKHAFAISLDNGVELLVHIGLETVALNGEGFEQLVEQGTKVKAGTPIIKINRDLIVSKGISLITPILITNQDILKSLDAKDGVDAIKGETVVLQYTVN